MSKVTHVTDANFDKEVLQSTEPVVVDFWATWCGPCRMMAPVLDETSEELAGKVKVMKIDVDQNPKTAGAYGIMSIPTIIVFKGGKPLGKVVGYVPKAQLKKAVEGAIA